MKWNYRVVKQTFDDKVFYGIHEVHYDLKGNVEHWTEKPIAPISETKQGLYWVLEVMIREAWNKPILEESDDGKRLVPDRGE